MRKSSLLRAVCGLLLFSAISSFSGCEKSGDAQPRAGKCGKTAPSDSTSTGGAS